MLWHNATERVCWGEGGEYSSITVCVVHYWHLYFRLVQHAFEFDFSNDLLGLLENTSQHEGWQDGHSLNTRWVTSRQKGEWGILFYKRFLCRGTIHDYLIWSSFKHLRELHFSPFSRWENWFREVVLWRWLEEPGPEPQSDSKVCSLFTHWCQIHRATQCDLTTDVKVVWTGQLPPLRLSEAGVILRLLSRSVWLSLNQARAAWLHACATLSSSLYPGPECPIPVLGVGGVGTLVSDSAVCSLGRASLRLTGAGVTLTFPGVWPFRTQS